jgi:hypothetical protein
MKKAAFDIHDYVTESLIKETVDRLSEALLTSTSHNYQDYGDIKIIDAATSSYKKYHDQAKNLPAIALIEVVLAANRNYNLHVLPNINRLKKDFPRLITFGDLNVLIKNRTPEEFYKIWGPKDAKKYQTLRNILSSAQAYKINNPDLSDFEVMKNWADKVDIEKYTADDIGKHKNIAIATMQHLRMAFGADTIKPDQRVMEVLEYEFGLKNINQINSIKAVEQISGIVNKPALLLDQIFVLYGSGYYNKHVRMTLANNFAQISMSIAKKLKMLGVNEDIISQSTGLTLSQISEL